MFTALLFSSLFAIVPDGSWLTKSGNNETRKEEVVTPFFSLEGKVWHFLGFEEPNAIGKSKTLDTTMKVDVVKEYLTRELDTLEEFDALVTNDQLRNTKEKLIRTQKPLGMWEFFKEELYNSFLAVKNWLFPVNSYLNNKEIVTKMTSVVTNNPVELMLEKINGQLDPIDSWKELKITLSNNSLLVIKLILTDDKPEESNSLLLGSVDGF